MADWFAVQTLVLYALVYIGQRCGTRSNISKEWTFSYVATSWQQYGGLFEPHRSQNRNVFALCSAGRRMERRPQMVLLKNRFGSSSSSMSTMSLFSHNGLFYYVCLARSTSSGTLQYLMYNSNIVFAVFVLHRTAEYNLEGILSKQPERRAQFGILLSELCLFVTLQPE